MLGFLDKQSALGRAMRGEVLNGVEMLLRGQDGSKACWISVTSRPMLDATGGCMGGVVVFSDVSARHELERQLVAAADSERRRIGEDLHDGLCQHLLSTALATQTLAAKLSARSLAEAEDASGIAELLGEAIAQARDTARGLYLVEAEAGGLRAALEAFAMDVRSRLRVACEFTENLSTPITDASMSVHLFRIAREAVNNAIRHAHASHITILLSTDEQRIVLTVEDDGEGFDKPNRNDGMGMHIMRYRARMLGATLEIGPRPAGGTSVICSVTRSDSTPKAPYAESN
jgi:signal transduction histidine kinase